MAHKLSLFLGLSLIGILAHPVSFTSVIFGFPSQLLSPMTAQVSETLIYHGKELMMFSNPLDPYLRATGIHFVSPHTANWRGYEGIWEIKGSEETGERLYLVALHAHRSYEDIVGLEEIFPGFPDGVFAHWFSGEIRLPQGNLLKYVHGGYASQYEYDLFLEIKKGVVMSKRAAHNTGDSNEH